MAHIETTAHETIAALGQPLSLARAMPEGDDMLIGRWRHGDARVGTSQSGAFRVLLSLGSTQHVRYQDPDHDAIKDVSAGDVGVLPAGVESTTAIDGDSDILQVFVAPAAVGPIARRERMRDALIGGQSEALRRDMVRLFVARALGDGPRRAQSASALRHTVARLLRSDASAERGAVSGGLTPAALRRVERLMCEALLSARPLSVRDLAEEAHLSLHHFVRAYRSSVGRTPYQELLSRRRRQALGFLADRTRSVAAIADTLGFSSHAHFTASFRESLGVTPSEYRRALAASLD